MKTLQKLSISLISILVINIPVYAQMFEIDFDKLKIGNQYKVLIKNGWETEGKLIQKDSNSIDIRTEYKIFVIPKSEIIDIVGASSEFRVIHEPDKDDIDIHEPDKDDIIDKSDFKKDKFYLSLGSGINFPSVYSFDDGLSFNNGINLQFNVMKIMSITHAIRGDIQFSHNPGINRVYEWGSAKADMNSYSAKFDFLLGSFKTTSKVNGYAILGGGLSIHKSSKTFSYRQIDPSTMQYTGQIISSTYEEEGQSGLNIDLGGGIRGKISDRVSLYGEAQYIFPFADLGKNGGVILYGIFFGMPSLKVGAQIEL